jgi:hypothetical protein
MSTKMHRALCKQVFIFYFSNLQDYDNINAVAVSAGANPTIASYNASVVNFYNATGSLARFENKNSIFYVLLKTL